MTIEAGPRAVNHGLPQRAFDCAADPVGAWVKLNEAALLAFWNEGNRWMDDEVTERKQALRRLG